MTTSRLKGYGSFFSDKLVKTTNVVSQFVSSSKTVSQLKEGLDKCITVGQQSIKEGYDQAASAAVKYVGQKNIEQISQQCGEYKKSISKNYEFVQSKVDECLKSEEVIKLKSMFDGSIDSILCSNLLFEVGLLLTPGSGSLYMTLKCSKYIVAACIFFLSSIKSYNVRKQDQNIHDKIDPYQKDVDEAYNIMSELNLLFLNIEEQLKKLNLYESSFIEANDFAIKKPFMKLLDKISIDNTTFLKSILEGAEKSAWLFYILEMACSYTPQKNVFIFLKIITFLMILLTTSLSSLQKNILKNSNEEQLSLLREKLQPVFSTMSKLQAKLNKDQANDVNKQDNKEHKVGLSNHLKSIAEATSKASSMYLLLQGVLPGHDNIEFVLCAFIMLFSSIDSYAAMKKQDEIKHSFQDVESKMQSLNEMKDRMKILLDEQKAYEIHLKELNQFKIQFLQKQGIFSEKLLAPESKSECSQLSCQRLCLQQPT